MSCTPNIFVISRNVDNTFVFTIKQNGSTLPLEIDVSDTFSYRLIRLRDDNEALTGTLTVENLLEGKVSLTIPSVSATSLESEKGTKTDRYYLKPTYKLMLICNTVNNGYFIAKVDQVYVD